MKNFFYILLALVTLSSCHKSRSYFPRDLEPEAVDVIRFDKALLNVQRDDVRGTKQDICVLYDEYPVFMHEWVESIIGLPVLDTAYLAEALPAFLDDTLFGFKQTNALEQELFADVSDLEQSLGVAFARIRYLYPEAEIPAIYLFVSGFQTPVYFGDDLIGIGADMYLGSDYEFYNRVVYEYQKQTMRKECIPVDVVSAYLFRTLPYTGKQNRLLDQMMYRGKIMYLTAQIFDDQPGYEVMGWTKEQWDWCVRNEQAIWHLVMDKRDLFKTEHMVLTSYLNEGPFTSEISQDSPGRLGVWLGWRIVESYMTHNDTVSLPSLMAEPDAQLILERSFYKP